MRNPHYVTRMLESALCEYTGAPYAVAVNSCTMALLLAVKWHLRNENWCCPRCETVERPTTGVHISIPKRTYVSVPQSIIHAGGVPVFRDEDWLGSYQLKPLPVWDCARWFTGGMYRIGAHEKPGWTHHVAGAVFCVSFHTSKILADTQGGAILHDDPEADAWYRRARFDGRTEGVPPAQDTFTLGYHCYMSPDVATRLLWKLSVLPKHNDPLPNDDYPDLSLTDWSAMV